MSGRTAVAPPVLTVGHSTHPIEVFLALLAAHGVERVVDVRRFPGSRRHPHFGREALDASLAAAGIEYVHAPELGGRRSGSAASPNRAWRVAAFRAYADYMDGDEFRSALRDVMEMAVERRVALMCAEAVPWRCHRRLIADALVARGVEVRHILGPGRADRHELHPAARALEGGRLVYPAPEDEQGELLG